MPSVYARTAFAGTYICRAFSYVEGECSAYNPYVEGVYMPSVLWLPSAYNAICRAGRSAYKRCSATMHFRVGIPLLCELLLPRLRRRRWRLRNKFTTTSTPLATLEIHKLLGSTVSAGVMMCVMTLRPFSWLIFFLPRIHRWAVDLTKVYQRNGNRVVSSVMDCRR